MRKIHRYLRRSLVPNLVPPPGGTSVRNFAIIGLIPLTALSVYFILSAISPSLRAPRLRSGSGNSLYVASNQVYRSTVGTKDGAPQISFSVGDSTASFVLAGIDKVNPKKESSTSVLFPSVQPDTDLRYTTTPNGLKEEIILHSAPKSNVYLFDFLLNNVTPKKLTNNFIDPSFKDAGGSYLFHFDKPFAVDANGERTDAVLLQIGQEKLPPSSEPCEGECSELYAPKYFMKIIVDQAWLSDPARVYPIVIDPTILHDTTAEFVAGTLNRLKDTGPGATATLESYYQELPADQYTVGLWHMNEASGNVLDSSGNNRTGTPTGTTVVTGKLGNTRNFTGADDISLGSQTMVDNLADVTVEAWIYPTAQTAATHFRVFSEENVLYVGQYGGQISFYMGNGTTWVNTSATMGAIPINQWTHVAWVKSGTTGSVFINGTLSATMVTSATLGTSANINYFSTYDGTNQPWTGSIDEVRISNIARTPEEIKSSASRRPYSIYTSDVLDLGGAGSFVTTWNPLQWSEHGVGTGDGETLKSSTGLVAQWNFNETSGITADNAEGTAALDGTLTGFDSTASQDADPDSSWTANNRRWGAGALQFDGVDSYVDVGSDASLKPTATLTVESWVNFENTASGIRFLSDWHQSATTDRWLFYTSAANQITWHVCNANEASTASITTNIKPGEWYHLVGTYDGTNSNLYVNGKLVGSSPLSGAMNAGTGASVRIGKQAETGNYFDGTIDSTRIYSRALGAAEIMSNYQAGNVEFQTRVGATTDPNDGSWEAWSPTSGETAIETYDGPYQYNTTDSGLVSYWPMDETADNTCSGGEDACDVKTTNHGTATGTKIVDGKYWKARSFNGSSDVISGGSTGLPTGNAARSIEAWVKSNTISGDHTIAGWGASGTSQANYINLNNNTFRFIGWSNDLTGPANVVSGQWYHVAATHDGTTTRLYVNGTEVVSGTKTLSTTSTNITIGTYQGYAAYFNGSIDEVRIYNTALSAAAIKQHYLEGSTRPESLHPMLDTTYKLEGTASQKIETGRPEVDSSTVALWHLDETGGTGAYIKDSTSNANHGTPTGTTTVNGISSKARSFNNTNTYLEIPASSVFNFGTGDWTFETWIKPTNFEICDTIYSQNNPYTILRLYCSDATKWEIYNNSVQYIGPTHGMIAGNWYHIAVVRNNNTIYLYQNGTLLWSFAVSTNPTNLSGAIWRIGNSTWAGEYFNGVMDEFRVSNTARTADEIAEAYRAGRDHYINRTISSTDLSAKTSLPFYVAADRPGTYLESIIGESAFANYQPDTNTVGLWHLSEQSGSGAYIKDSSGVGNHGTPTGTTFTQGKIGKGSSFNNTNSYIQIPASSVFNFGTGDWTFETWIKPTNFEICDTIYSQNNPYTILRLYCSDATKWEIYNNSVQYIGPTHGMIAGNWYHIAVVRNNNTIYLYQNGTLLWSFAVSTNPTNLSGAIWRIGNSTWAGEYFNGVMDEFRVSNTARTADEIRQAYEVGLRTHPITIDFGAKLDSGNLITGSGDLGFTVDATYYGLQNKGDMLFKGDKVIVRENYDGTEYIAQGTVDAITASTGATTVSAWDSGSTFPSGGYTVNASVFKWQREYWNPSASLTTHRNAITNLSLRLTDGAEGRTIWLDDLRSTSGYLTDSSGSTITSSTGSRYMQYRAILSSFDEAVSATLSAVTVDYVINTTPATPSLDAPSDTATNQILSTVLKTTSTDADSDYLRYKIELCDDVGMTTGCQTFDQTSSQTGWSGQNAQTSTAYTSGTQATYTLQTPLTVASTYYWRSYAIDPAGVNTWSGTQTPYSFTTTTAPTAPTVPYAEGASNPTGIIDLTPEFSAIHNDPDSDAADYYEIDVNTASDFTGTVMWASGALSMASLASGVRSTDVSYAGTAIPLDGAGTIYYWRIRFTDVQGATGAWSTTQNFTMNTLPTTPSLDSPTDTATNQALTPALKTTTTDADADYLRYKIQLCTDLAMTADCQTFDQTSSQTNWSGQDAQTGTAYASGTQATYTLTANLVPNTPYYWRTYAIDPAGSNTWSGTQTPYSFTTIKLSESFNCLINETSDDSSLTIVWTDRTDSEDSYKLERNVDSGGFSAFQTLAADTISYQDTSISSGHTYQYRVAPYVSAGSSYGAWCTTSTLSLQLGTLNYSGLNFSGFNIN